MFNGLVVARMGSARLPGKVLRPLMGRPMIEHIVSRLKTCANISSIIVATTENQEDDVIEDWSKDAGIGVFRGSEEDVLRRVAGAGSCAKENASVVVLGDNPLICPVVLESCCSTYVSSSVDYLSTYSMELGTKDERMFPVGVRVQIIDNELLNTAHVQATSPYHREHLGSYFKDNLHALSYRLVRAEGKFRKCAAPDTHLAINTESEYRFVKWIYEQLYDHNINFTLFDVMSLLSNREQ